jgi:hypothetical protein
MVVCAVLAMLNSNSANSGGVALAEAPDIVGLMRSNFPH